MSELIRDPSRHIDENDPAARPRPAAQPPVERVGHLGEPLQGDETAGLGGAAPDEAVGADDGAPPARRQIGQGLSGDSQNFQGGRNQRVPEAGGPIQAGGAREA